MTVKIQTNSVDGPHVILDGKNSHDEVTLKIRQFYVGPGKLHLMINHNGKRTKSIVVDAADLLAAVTKLVPEAVS